MTATKQSPVRRLARAVKSSPAKTDTRLDELQERIARAIQRRDEVLEAYLFGSHALGTAQAHSDLDIAVYVRQTPAAASGYGYAAELTAYLMSALGTNDVDVLVLNDAPPVLYHRVLRDGRRILARDLRATTTREGYALSRYCDFVPQLAKMERARAGAVGRAR
jgi:hypothetical protein